MCLVVGLLLSGTHNVNSAAFADLTKTGFSEYGDVGSVGLLTRCATKDIDHIMLQREQWRYSKNQKAAPVVVPRGEDEDLEDSGELLDSIYRDSLDLPEDNVPPETRSNSNGDADFNDPAEDSESNTDNGKVKDKSKRHGNNVGKDRSNDGDTLPKAHDAAHHDIEVFDTTNEKYESINKVNGHESVAHNNRKPAWTGSIDDLADDNKASNDRDNEEANSDAAHNDNDNDSDDNTTNDSGDGHNKKKNMVTTAANITGIIVKDRHHQPVKPWGGVHADSDASLDSLGE